jgi:uncharacterized peroxidase-related enzyme
LPYFPSLPQDAGVRHIAALNPLAGRALIELHQAALRNRSRLAPQDKELLAAFVSALNACHYCFGVHTETAKAFGVDVSVLDALIADPATAPIDAKLKPLFAYARKLTLTPARMTAADAEAVFAAGWDEAAFHDAILTVCLFNFMNRLVEGHGVKGNKDLYVTRGRALRRDGYAPMLEMLNALGAPPPRPAAEGEPA